MQLRSVWNSLNAHGTYINLFTKISASKKITKNNNKLGKAGASRLHIFIKSFSLLDFMQT